MATNFVYTDYDVGEVKENSKFVVFFHQTSDKEIKKVRPTCKCTKYRKTKDSHAFYSKTKPVPVGVSSYNISRYIVIEYADGDQDILSFTAKVVKS